MQAQEIINKVKMKKRYIFVFLFICIWFINSFFGWFGYKKWEYRRATYGNQVESISRDVFVKKLNFKSNFDTINFNAYIERGFWYGYLNSNDTRFENSKFPFQISYNSLDVKKDVYLDISKVPASLDSIDRGFYGGSIIFLSQNKFNDTLVLCIKKFEQPYDSIGYIKIWDN